MCQIKNEFKANQWQYIHQKPTFFTGTVYNNLMIVHNLSNNNKKEKVEELILLTKIFGIYEFLGHEVHSLSVGTQQKVALVRLLLSKPELVILDESLANLDMKSTTLVLEILKRINRSKNTTIMIVSHNLSVLSKIASDFIVVIDGSIVELFESENLRSDKHKAETNQYLELNL